MSATLASVALTVWTIPRLSAPMCSFIPKCQLRPLRVCFISGSRLALAFLVELGAAMMVASTMVPERSSSRRSSNRSATASKMAWVSPCCSSRWRKRRIVLSSGTTSSPSSTRAKHRLAVVDRIFGLWVRQIEPLLQEINPQHLLQSQRLATLAGFGVVRFDQPDQPRPWNHRIHLGQEPLAPRDFALPIPRQRCKRPLITHLLSSTSANPTNYLYPNRNTYAELP